MVRKIQIDFDQIIQVDSPANPLSNSWMLVMGKKAKNANWKKKLEETPHPPSKMENILTGGGAILMGGGQKPIRERETKRVGSIFVKKLT